MIGTRGRIFDISQADERTNGARTADLAQRDGLFGSTEGIAGREGRGGAAVDAGGEHERRGEEECGSCMQEI